MENKQENVGTDLSFEEYLQDTQKPVLRGELGEILGGLMETVGLNMDEVAQPSLQAIKAVSILIQILKNKGIIEDKDFIEAEKQYTDRLKGVMENERQNDSH